VEKPNDVESIKWCNRNIAEKFSPKIHQWSNILSDNNPDANFDRIVKVNFDNDWVATDNWLSMDEIEEHDVTPCLYYTVLWTENLWIIVYTYYFARDWANGGFECDEDEHEGDFAKVLVVAKRATNAADEAKDLLLGFATTKGNEDCIDIGDNAFTVTDRIQPFISSAAGSHHNYTANDHRGIVDYDGSVNPCKLFGQDLIIYEYGEPATSELIPLVGDCLSLLTLTLQISALDIVQGTENYRNKMIEHEVENGNAPSSNTDFYDLIDIFDEDEGLWERRTNSDLFTEGDILNQRLQCDNGDGCGNEGVLWVFATADMAPWAPWTGNMGVNPLEFIQDEFDNKFCNYTVTDHSYEYNPYLCELYDIVMPEKFLCDGELTTNPIGSNNTVFVNLQLSAAGVLANAEVTWCWELPPGFNNPISCVGCSQAPVNNCVITGSDIVLKIENATLQSLWSDPEQFVVTAETDDLIECGAISKEFSLDVQLQGLVSTDTADCEKMLFEVKEEWHIDGNVYDWDFPLYDALATVSNGGRRVEFNTASVIEGTSTTTNPERKLDYSLTVTNPSSETVIEVNGDREIPDCYYGSLGLIVYPNPADDNIYLEFKGVNPEEEAIDIHVFDHQFNRVGRGLYNFSGQSIDISALRNGLYLLCAVTKEGKMFTRKFCVGH
jgi:hypothetical protein